MLLVIVFDSWIVTVLPLAAEPAASAVTVIAALPVLRPPASVPAPVFVASDCVGTAGCARGRELGAGVDHAYEVGNCVVAARDVNRDRQRVGVGIV